MDVMDVVDRMDTTSQVNLFDVHVVHRVHAVALSLLDGFAMPAYSEKIEVECKGEVPVPVAFTWRDQVFHIEKILRSWQDFRFPAGAPRKKTWRLRRHRNYFAVRTAEGRTFEIYLDREATERTWVLYREIQE